MGLAAVAAFAYVVTDSGSRYWLRRFEPYLAALLALTIFLPVLIWNYQHDWASFAFQTVRRVAEPPRFSLFGLIGSSLILLGPIGFLTVIAAAKRSTARELVWSDDPPLVRRRWMIAWLVGLPLGVFAVFSLRHQVKVDWTGAPWVVALPLMAYAMVAWRVSAGPFRAWLAAAWPAALAVFLAFYLVGFTYLAVGLPGAGYSSQMELSPVGWRELARQAGQIARGIETAGDGKLLIVGMDRYETASELAFYSADPLTAIDATSAGHLFGGVGLMYERWFPAQRTVASNLLLISWNRSDLADARLQPYVDRLGPLSTGTIEHDGRFVRNYFYRTAYGYPKVTH
jgi:dolichol-phosphate mannosyltransferase